MARLKLALLTPYLPAPADSGGRIRIDQLARALARRSAVHLFASAHPRDAAAYGARPELEHYSSVHVAHRPLGFLPGLDRPARVRRVSGPDLLKAVQCEDARAPFDAVVVEHVHAAGLIDAIRPLPWVLDEHNIESDYWLARAGNSAFLRRVRATSIGRHRRWEERAWKRATQIVAVSEHDAERIARVRGRPAVVLPNGVRLRELTFREPSARGGHEILFVGVLGHPPNTWAARFLVEQVLPRVQRHEPRAHLTLCGADPPRELHALAGPSVTVTGRVASVAPFLERAAVYANPVRHAAGTSLKVVEALACGIPLVSTATGVRGFCLAPPAHYLEATSADEFACAILACLRDRADRDTAAHLGRRVAEAHDFERIAEEFADVVEHTARSAGGRAANG